MKKEILFLTGIYAISLVSAFISPDKGEVIEVSQTRTGNMLFIGGIIFAIILSIIIHFILNKKEKGVSKKK